MEYGYIINGQLIREKQQTERNKPLAYTDEPAHEGNQATAYSWEDKGEYIEQVWTVMDVEPIDEYPPDAPTADKSLTRYINELTGGNDTDLVSATETLIKNNIVED
jgi:hypothetical protein